MIRKKPVPHVMRGKRFSGMKEPEAPPFSGAGVAPADVRVTVRRHAAICATLHTAADFCDRRRLAIRIYPGVERAGLRMAEANLFTVSARGSRPDATVVRQRVPGECV